MSASEPSPSSTTPTPTRSTRTRTRSMPGSGPRPRSTGTTSSTSGPSPATRTCSAAFRNVDGFSNAYGVSLEPSAFGPDAHRIMSFLALDPPRHTRMRSLVGKGFTPVQGRRDGGPDPPSPSSTCEPALERGSFDFIADFAGKLPMDVISELVGVPGPTGPRSAGWPTWSSTARTGVYDVPPAGMEAALDPGRLLPGHGRRARTVAQGRPHLGPARRRDRRRQADRRGDHRLPLPHGGGRQRDDHQAARATPGTGAGATPTSGPSRSPTRPGCPTGWRRPSATTRSSQMLLRVARAPVELHGTTIPEGERVLLLVGSANRDEAVFPEPDRYDLDRDTSRLVSFGSGRHFCMGPRWPGSRRRVALEELVARVADYDVDPDGHRRVHSDQRAGLGRPAHHRHAALMPRFPAHPDRRPAVVTGASSGIGRATAKALAAAGHPVVLGPAGSTSARTRRPPSGPTAARPSPSTSTWPTPTRSSVRRRGRGRRRADRDRGLQRRPEMRRAPSSTPNPTTSTACSGSTSSGTHRLVRALLSGMVARRRGDIVFVTSDVVDGPGRPWPPT